METFRLETVPQTVPDYDDWVRKKAIHTIAEALAEKLLSEKWIAVKLEIDEPPKEQLEEWRRAVLPTDVPPLPPKTTYTLEICEASETAPIAELLRLWEA